MKKLQCTKCKTVFWIELRGIDENLVGRGEWIQSPCPKCGEGWAAVEIEAGKLKVERRKLKPLEAGANGGKEISLAPNRIKNLRKKLGISQKGLASLVSVSPGAVINWEKGKFRPRDEKVREMDALLSKGKAEVQKILAEMMVKKPMEKKPVKAMEEKVAGKPLWVRKKAAKKKGV